MHTGGRDETDKESMIYIGVRERERVSSAATLFTYAVYRYVMPPRKHVEAAITRAAYAILVAYMLL